MPVKIDDFEVFYFRHLMAEIYRRPHADDSLSFGDGRPPPSGSRQDASLRARRLRGLLDWPLSSHGRDYGHYCFARRALRLTLSIVIDEQAI